MHKRPLHDLFTNPSRPVVRLATVVLMKGRNQDQLLYFSVLFSGTLAFTMKLPSIL